jgi:hypothetical protein
VLPMKSAITIGLDYSHNNMLKLEESSYADFTQFLFASGYKIGRIEAGFDSLAKLNGYDMIIISTPKNYSYGEQEINLIHQYVKEGGHLLLISSRGGDYLNRTNFNDICIKFGFEFEADEIFDSVKYVNLQKRPILDDFTSHYITDQIQKIVFSSACSLKVLDFVEADKNIKLNVLIKGSINCWRNRFDGAKWEEEDSPKIPLMVCSEYYKGKVVAFGSLSIFSSLGREYGFSAFNNDILIANMLRWLTLDVKSEGKAITVDLQRDLFNWLDSITKEDNWDSFSNIINISLKYFKDNYKNIMQELKDLKKEMVEKIKLKKEEEVKPEKEEAVLKLIPERKREDLKDIITAIEEISGEKYELSLEIEDEYDDESDEEDEEQVLEELPDDLTSLTVKQLKAYCKKHKIELPNSARKSDIIRIIKYVLNMD